MNKNAQGALTSSWVLSLGLKWVGMVSQWVKKPLDACSYCESAHYCADPSTCGLVSANEPGGAPNNGPPNRIPRRSCSLMSSA